MSAKRVPYRLTTLSGYKANIVKMGHNGYDEVALYHKANFPDVELTRPNTDTDLRLLDTKCLMTVNGYVYPTVYSGNRLYIPNATTSMLKSKINHIGMLSFNQLNTELKKRPITEDMISLEDGVSPYEKVIITFPEEVSSCFLVLAGYLIFEQPEFFYRVSDSSFVLRLDRLNYMERLYELSRYRNIFEELEVEVSPNNPTMVMAEEVRSLSVITKLLTIFNTFLVEVPNHTVTVNKTYLERSNIPGNFRTEVRPNSPLMGGYGKLVEYITLRNNDTKYTIHTDDAYMNNHLFSKLSTAEINVYNGHRVPGTLYRLSQAFFLDIDCFEN